MREQAQEFLDDAEREELPCTILIRDHDGAFTKEFDAFIGGVDQRRGSILDMLRGFL